MKTAPPFLLRLFVFMIAVLTASLFAVLKGCP